MHIPRIWSQAKAEARTADGRIIPVAAWGWGDDDRSAKDGAADRLQRLLDRIRRGEPFPDAYGYGTRPPREEILDTIASQGSDQDAAMVTRNRYGAQVLNTATLLFLDIDLPPTTFTQWLSGLFGGGRGSAQASALDALRGALERQRATTFRVYRTAAGFRAIAVDRDFDPAGQDAQDLMRATGTDPAFSRLCVAQRSFRARLTPKPWRCDCPLPPGVHPREDRDLQQRFASWLRGYEAASNAFATCRYVETVGSGRPAAPAAALIELHDRITRSDSALPLA